MDDNFSGIDNIIKDADNYQFYPQDIFNAKKNGIPERKQLAEKAEPGPAPSNDIGIQFKYGYYAVVSIDTHGFYQKIKKTGQSAILVVKFNEKYSIRIKLSLNSNDQWTIECA